MVIKSRKDDAVFALALVEANKKAGSWGPLVSKRSLIKILVIDLFSTLPQILWLNLMHWCSQIHSFVGRQTSWVRDFEFGRSGRMVSSGHKAPTRVHQFLPPTTTTKERITQPWRRWRWRAWIPRFTQNPTRPPLFPWDNLPSRSPYYWH